MPTGLSVASDELQRRHAREISARRPIKSPDAAYRYWCEVICASDRYCLCKEHLVSVSSMTETLAEPSDILALCAGAESLPPHA